MFNAKTIGILVLLTAVAGITYITLKPAVEGAFITNANQKNKLTDGLVGFWTFDGVDMDWSTALVVRDRSGSNNHGSTTNMSTTTSPISGAVGQGLNFNGNTNIVRVGNNLDNLGPVTISAWLRPNQTISSNQIIFTTDALALGDGYAFHFMATNAIRFYVDYTPTQLIRLSTNNTVTVGEWQHYLVTWDGSQTAANVHIYRNGEEVTYQTTTNGSGTVDDSATTKAFSTPNGTGSNLNAGLDEARIYNRILSLDEIKRLYLMGASTITNASQNKKLNDGESYIFSFDGPDIDLSLPTAEVRDRSGFDQHADWQNHASTTVAGKIGQAIWFDGVNDQVDIGADVKFIKARGSISVWIKPEGTPTTVTDVWESQVIVAADDPAGSSFGIFRGTVTNNGGTDRIRVYNFDTNADIISIPYTNNEWTHIAIVHGGGTLYGYKNGELVGSTASGDTFKSGDGFIGGGVALSQYFKGSIDEVRISDRIFSAEDVKRFYLMGASLKTNSSQNQKLTDGLVALWSFDGPDMDWTTQNQVRDRSGQNNHGSTTGAGMGTTTSPIKGKIGQALQFDGVNDYVNIGSPASLAFDNQNTIAAWVKFDSLPAGGEVIVGSSGRFSLNLRADHEIRHADDWGNAVDTASFESLGLNLGEWHHIVGVFSGVNSETRSAANSFLYIDGVSRGATYQGSWGPSGAGDVDIGRDPCCANANFDGSLDDVRIYNRALSADEVKRLYLMGGG